MDFGLSFWFFHVPNYLLSALFYTLIGRYILSFIFKEDSQMVFWRVIVQLTDPFLKLVRAITPLLIPNGVIMIFALVWTFILRMVLFVLARGLGILSGMGA